MRFVSHVRNFAVGIIETRSHPTQYGALVVDQEGYTAHFKQDVTDADIAFAERVFEREGLVVGRTTEVDEVTLTPLLNRISVFDTEEEALRENWDGRTIVDDRGERHDFKEYVESKLARRAIDHQDFALMIEDPIEAPWPRYLDFQGSLDQLMQKIVDDGYDPSAVLAYERQSGKRPAVIERLEALLLAGDPAEEVPA